MIIRNVKFKNFRPFFSEVQVDLTPEKERNIILIGGRNGQGKTSFLVGLVWCLYGKLIDSVDRVFREEVKGNYTRFLNRSLNWTAQKEGFSDFSVEIQFSEVLIPDGLKLDSKPIDNVILKRSYSLESSKERVELFFNGSPHQDLQEEEEIRFFIQDYLVPIELAKFIFFDAEKIADIASLGVRDRASLMNKTLGQVLGLSPYEDLIKDLEIYEKELKKKEAKGPIELEINSIEQTINSNNQLLIQIEENLSELDEKDDKLKHEISELSAQLISRGNTVKKADIAVLNQKREQLKKELQAAQIKFSEIESIIPFAMVAHKMEEIKDALETEKQQTESEIQRVGFAKRLSAFSDQLFNKPPFPEDDIGFEQKVFYFNKAKEMLSVLAGENESKEELPFYHELDRSEVDHFNRIFDLVRRYSYDFIEGTFKEYIRLQNELQDIETQIRSAEGEIEDEIALDLQDQKIQAEKEREVFIKEKGKLQEQKDRILLDNEKLEGNLNKFLRRVKASQEVKGRIKKTEQYLKTVRAFVKKEKDKKKTSLEHKLQQEFNSLFHKKDFISRVEVTILRKNLGMEVNLYDKNSREIIPGSDMSKGEQQLYASALLKTVLSESITNLPIFIDTPLGRLDQEHRDNILTYYYPSLAEQIVILSTNTEIRRHDLTKIEKKIAGLYLLENKEQKTTISPGYFK